MKKIFLFLFVCITAPPVAQADESLFGALKGAETLPENALEFVQHLTRRYDKGQGNYNALDSKTELEYGITNRLTGAVYVLGQAIQTEGLLINGYIPKDENYSGLSFFTNKKIATSYPKILQKFFKEKGIKVEIEEIGGSVEIAPGIGLADAIFDIVSTGSTLLMNGLKEVEIVTLSEAVLIGNNNINSDAYTFTHTQ